MRETLSNFPAVEIICPCDVLFLELLVCCDWPFFPFTLELILSVIVGHMWYGHIFGWLVQVQLHILYSYIAICCFLSFPPFTKRCSATWKVSYFFLSYYLTDLAYQLTIYLQAAASISDGKRILFRFDRAAFSFKFLPFKVPYPVPFRLLGDEAKGWLDTTYLSQSGNLRISRGNKVNEILRSRFPYSTAFFISQMRTQDLIGKSHHKNVRLRVCLYLVVVQGTTFVLQKLTEPRQLLLSAISTGKGIEKVNLIV